MRVQALNRLELSELRLSRRQALRAAVAGSTWALLMTAGLAAMAAWHCGMICLPEVADNAALSLLGGILGIGAVAAYGGRK